MRNSQRVILVSGYTLLELLVAATLSSFLAISLLIFCSSCLKFNLLINQESEALENMRYGSFYLRSQIKQAENIKGIMADTVEYQHLKAKKGTDAFLIELKSRLHSKSCFFIAENSYSLSTTKKTFSLYVKQPGKPRLELLPGISQMKIFYGIKCLHSDNICWHFPSEAVTHWEQVRSVQIVWTFIMNNQPIDWRLYFALTS